MAVAFIGSLTLGKRGTRLLKRFILIGLKVIIILYRGKHAYFGRQNIEGR